MEDIISKRIADWTSSPYDENTIGEIKHLVSEKLDSELEDRFYTILKFGTGGLRGIIGAGTNRMNAYTVGMATQGLANYIIKKGVSDKGVVIARDSRRMSDEFAKEASSVLAGNGIKVYYFKDIAPTPFVSFAIKQLKAVSGIVVTASHNPPEYNGYKVYWQDGGQIIYPQDKDIISEVENIKSINDITKIDFNEGVRDGIISIIEDDILKSYINTLETVVYRKPEKSDIKIAYTPLHGTGYKIIPEVLSHFGFKDVFLEEKQKIPDGDFPTVEFPNPEEKEAMAMIIDLAKKKDADLIIATDPDADRMGVGFKDKNGDYLLINGNQIGTMLEYYLLKRAKESGKLPDNGTIIKTIVTTELQKEIALDFNCKIDDVLTGFKWIAAKMKEFDETGESVFIFGGEESYGYLPVSFVRDKDAVSSTYFFAEMADWLKSKGETLYDFLNEIFSKYGYYQESLHSLTLKGIDGIEKIKQIMENFRKNPPFEFAGIDVDKINDIGEMISKTIKDKKAVPIRGLPSSNVLQFFLQDGTKITMRPSGTEPKIKFYFSVNEKGEPEKSEEIKQNLNKKIYQLKSDLLKKVNAI